MSEELQIPYSMYRLAARTAINALVEENVRLRRGASSGVVSTIAQAVHSHYERRRKARYGRYGSRS